MSELDHQRIGDYLVRRRIGAGGMGQVYEAEEMLSGRRVALKVLHDELAGSEDARRRFVNEMAILTRLDSPHIVRCLHCTEVEGKLIVALEYLEGQTLRERLGARGALPWPEVATLCVQIARALEVAHGQSPPVVHRDLKPENVLVDPSGQLKVLDFGIAKVLEHGQQRTTQAVGTLQYMSPEHIDARALDSRADLFSLGVVMWELLAGYPPFHSDSPRELLNMICVSPTPALPALHPAPPPELVELIEALLSKSAAQRPAHAQTVREQLEALLERAPVSVHPQALATAPTTSAVAMAPTLPVDAMHASGHAPTLDTAALIDESDTRRAGRGRGPLVLLVSLAVFGLAAGAFLLLRDTRHPPAPPADPPAQPASTPETPARPSEANKPAVPAPPVEPGPSARPPQSLAELLPPAEPSPEQAKIIAEAAQQLGLAALRENDNLGAFQHFARATANGDEWKYPYNMACAAARAGNMEVQARLALEAAVLRNPKTTRKKAQRERDFDSLRERDWFRALVVR